MEPLKLNDDQKLLLKKELKKHCVTLLQQRIEELNQSVDAAREAANSEDKSSAGDKYETSRAMGHLQQEMLGEQLETAMQELDFVSGIEAGILHQQVGLGTVLVTAEFVAFVAAGLGAVHLHGQKYFLLSPKAPLAVALHNKQQGERVLFNGKQVVVKQVF